MLKETTRLLDDDAVEKLTQQQKMVYILSRNEGLDYNAIATKMGITRSTVKNHMTRALQSLRQHLLQNSGELVTAAILFELLT